MTSFGGLEPWSMSHSALYLNILKSCSKIIDFSYRLILLRRTNPMWKEEWILTLTSEALSNAQMCSYYWKSKWKQGWWFTPQWGCSEIRKAKKTLLFLQQNDYGFQMTALCKGVHIIIRESADDFTQPCGHFNVITLHSVTNYTRARFTFLLVQFYFALTPWISEKLHQGRVKLK